MEKAKVYYTDFRTIAFGDGLPTKLKKLIQKAGIGQIDMDGKFVAIKMHFGEQGNISFLRPNYARAVVDVVKELGGKPFLTDCNTMYPGSRKNAIEHLYCAWENGFTPLTVGCPVIIGDGLKGTDDIGVPVAGGEYVKEARIGRAIMDADVFISLSHFKGHEMSGFGGTTRTSAWLRLTRGQDRAALQRQAEHQRGRLSRLPPLPARMRQRRSGVRQREAQDARRSRPMRRLRPLPGRVQL